MTHHVRGGHGGARDGVGAAIVPGRGHTHSLGHGDEMAAFISHSLLLLTGAMMSVQSPQLLKDAHTSELSLAHTVTL